MKSRLVLGTVQLGMPYGISNTAGQPSLDESFSILDAARDGGINTFDTSHAYGSAEEVMGKWLSTRRIQDVFLITKFQPNVLDEHPSIPAAEAIDAQLRISLGRLGVECVDGYLLHTSRYLSVDGVVEGLRRVKEKGLARNIGVSAYDEADALRAIDLGFDYVQVPYNALDQRLDRTGFFEKAKAAGVTVFARSPFLQGLLLMEPERIPPHLAHAKKHVVRFQAIAKKHGLAPLEASLIFVYGHSHITHVVFGVEKPAQLREGLAAIKKASRKSHESFTQEVKDSFKKMDLAVVNPSLWVTKAQK